MPATVLYAKTCSWGLVALLLVERRVPISYHFQTSHCMLALIARQGVFFSAGVFIVRAIHSSYLYLFTPLCCVLWKLLPPVLLVITLGTKRGFEPLGKLSLPTFVNVLLFSSWPRNICRNRRPRWPLVVLWQGRVLREVSFIRVRCPLESLPKCP